MPAADDDDSGGGRTKRRLPTHPEGLPTTDVRVVQLELHNAEYFGRDGEGGTFRALQKRVHKLETEMDTIKTFRIKALTTIGLATALGATLAGIIGIAFEHYLSK